MALDGQKRGLHVARSNEHMSAILSTAGVRVSDADDDGVCVDIDVEDYFQLADLKVIIARVNFCGAIFVVM